MGKRIVIDNIAEQRYELDLGDTKAFVEYSSSDGVITLTHAYVPPKYEGQGIGSELVQGTLELIRNKKLKVVPQCTFVDIYMRRHTEWIDMIYRDAILK